MKQSVNIESGPIGALKLTNLAVSFLLELCALAAFAYWGYGVGGNPLVKILLAVGIPLVVGIIWGVFIAPRSVITLPKPLNFTLRLVVFGLAALALAAAGLVTLAWVFAIVVILNYALIAVWKQ